MSVNSKVKGNAFELKVSKLFSENYNDHFKRVPQSGALVGGVNRQLQENLRQDAKEILAGDIITPVGFPWAIECKAYKTDPEWHQLLNGSCRVMDDWIEQAKGDADVSGKDYLIVFKRNFQGTYAAFSKKVFDKFFMFKVQQGFLRYKNTFIVPLDDFLEATKEVEYK